MELKEIISLDKWLTAYLILKAIDFATGFIKAYRITGWKSSKLRDGVKNFFLEIILIFVAGILDDLLGLSILMIATKMLFVYKEFISITENAGACGVTIPKIFADKIQELNPDKKGEDNNE